MSAPDRLSAAQIAAAVNAGRTSAVAVAEDTLARVEAYDAVQPQIWISRAAREDILAAAHAIDARIAAGENLPLAGVPFAVKDNIDVGRPRYHGGLPGLRLSSGGSATVVARLTAAGALCIGKTNLDQFATGLVGTRSPYGIPRNASNLAYVSGGSSSGSSVTVAAGLVAFALGTDTAGRAAFRRRSTTSSASSPPRGAGARRASSRPAARSTASPCSPTTPPMRGWSTASWRPSTRPIPIPSRWPTSRSEPGASACRAASSACGSAMPSPNSSTTARWKTSRSWANSSRSTLPAAGGRTASLRRSVGGRAHRCGRGAAGRKPDAIDPTVRSIVEPGADVSAVDLFNGMYRLAAIKRHADLLWADIDMMAFPTTGTTTACPNCWRRRSRSTAISGLYTNFVNLLDMAALAVPAGIRGNATGFGITLIGPADTDRALLDVADTYLSVADLPPPPSLDLEGKMQTVKLAVVGAHLKDMPLHWQLTSRDAKFVGAFETAPTYRLYAIADSVPPKPALIHSDDGAPIAVEVYELGVAEFGSFVVEVPAPLAIGTVTLADAAA